MKRIGKTSRLVRVMVLCFAVAVGTLTGYAQGSDLKILNDQALSLPAPERNGWEHSMKGKVAVQIIVSNEGHVTSAKALPGDSGRPFLLADLSEEAAMKATFPKKRLEGVLIYNFPIPEIAASLPTPKPTPAASVPASIMDSYFTDVHNVVVFADVKDTDPYYLDLKQLASAGSAFGYADKKFHGEMYLSRGDLAYFLGKTMDQLKRQASFIKVDFQKFYRPYHDLFYKNKPITDISDLKASQPYYSQVVSLANNYKVYLFDFQGSDPMTLNAGEHFTHKDVRTLFRYIFREYGSDFNSTITDKIPSDEVSMTRGEFAIYLNQFEKYMTKAFVLESIADSK